MRLLIALLAICLSGCGGVQGVKDTVTDVFSTSENPNPPNELVDFDPTAKIDEVWSNRVGKGSRKQFLKLTPAVTETAIYTADQKGIVTAVDATTGDDLWRTKIKAAITGGPGAGEGLVLVGTANGEVVALEETSGEILWRARVSSEVLAAPTAKDGFVVVRSADGKLFGLMANTGNRVWIYDRTVPSLTLRGNSAPVISQDMVVAGFDSGRLVAVELQTGKLVWETLISVPSGRSDLERMVDIDAEPLIMDDMVYVAAFQGKIAAVSLFTGRIEWAREISSYAGLSIDSEYVFLTDSESHVWALDRLSGTSVWKQEQLHGRLLTAPTSFAGYVVAGDFEGYLHWIDRRTGEIAARKRLDRSPLISPTISSGDVLIGFSSKGVLSAFMPIE